MYYTTEKICFFSGRGTSNSSRTEAVSPAVHIDVDATPAPAALGIILFGNLDK